MRDFTVQIRHAETDEIVGTGIAISMDGEIVTCKHVFEGAVITPAEDIEKGEVGVYFPRAKGVKKDRRAKLARYFSDSDDDVVVLQVIGKPPPLAPEQIAILSDAERSEGNPFRSYGYCPLGAHVASRASGEIMGDEKWHHQLDPGLRFCSEHCSDEAHAYMADGFGMFTV